MSWVKIDDKAWSHPKFAGISLGAVGLWLWALCWCSQHETDGKIATSKLTQLGGTKRLASELVQAGLWHETDLGWAIHDYLNFQPSRAQREELRRQTKDRVTRHRKRDANGDVTPLPNKCNENETPPRAQTRAGLGSGSVSESPEGVSGEPHRTETKTRCPKNLRLAPEEIDALELSPGIPAWAIEAMSGPLVATFLSSDPRPIAAWHRTLVKAICAQWSDPKKRPSKPQKRFTSEELEARKRADEEFFAKRDAEARAKLRERSPVTESEAKSIVASTLAHARSSSTRA